MKKLKKKMSRRRYNEKNKAKIAAKRSKKYAEDEEYRVQKKMMVRRYNEDNKAKIAAYRRKKYADNKEYRETQVAKERNKYAENQREAMVARMARAREKKEMNRLKGLLLKGQGEEGNAPGEGPPQKAKMARIAREAGMELDEVREKELFEQMMTAQANLLKHVADVVVVCRAQCERLQQPRA